MSDVYRRLADSADRVLNTRDQSFASTAKAMGYQLVATPSNVQHGLQVGDYVRVVKPEWVTKLEASKSAASVVKAMVTALGLVMDTTGTVVALLTPYEVLLRDSDGKAWVQRVWGGLRPGTGEMTLIKITIEEKILQGATT